jgi:hypothetical protein
MAFNGQLTTSNLQNLTSNADILIGAYYDSARNKPSSEFSGSIDSVNLYGSLLTPSQINQLYKNSQLSYSNLSSQINASIPIFPNLQNSTITSTTSLVNTTSTTLSRTLSDSLPLSDSITTSLANTTLVNTTSLVNETQLTINPQLRAEKKSYSITDSPHLEFQYFNDSSILKIEQTKISKELVQIDKAEKILNTTEVAINSTAAKNHLISDTNIKEAQQHINDVQQQIDQAQQQIQDTQQTIQQALTHPSSQ